MDELKQLLIEECKLRIKEGNLSVAEIYDIAVVTDMIKPKEVIKVK